MYAWLLLFFLALEFMNWPIPCIDPRCLPSGDPLPAFVDLFGVSLIVGLCPAPLSVPPLSAAAFFLKLPRGYESSLSRSARFWRELSSKLFKFGFCSLS
jgi:hypothetical protein